MKKLKNTNLKKAIEDKRNKNDLICQLRTKINQSDTLIEFLEESDILFKELIEIVPDVIECLDDHAMFNSLKDRIINELNDIYQYYFTEELPLIKKKKKKRKGCSFTSYNSTLKSSIDYKIRRLNELKSMQLNKRITLIENYKEERIRELVLEIELLNNCIESNKNWNKNNIDYSKNPKGK